MCVSSFEVLFVRYFSVKVNIQFCVLYVNTQLGSPNVAKSLESWMLTQIRGYQLFSHNFGCSRVALAIV